MWGVGCRVWGVGVVCFFARFGEAVFRDKCPEKNILTASAPPHATPAPKRAPEQGGGNSTPTPKGREPHTLSHLQRCSVRSTFPFVIMPNTKVLFGSVWQYARISSTVRAFATRGAPHASTRSRTEAAAASAPWATRSGGGDRMRGRGGRGLAFADMAL